MSASDFWGLSSTLSSRYAFGAIAEWQCRLGVSQQGMSGSRPLKDMTRLRLRRAHSEGLNLLTWYPMQFGPACNPQPIKSKEERKRRGGREGGVYSLRLHSLEPDPCERIAGIPCMTQLQIKHSDAYNHDTAEEDNPLG